MNGSPEKPHPEKSRPEGPHNTAQLHGDINKGRTGDKVAGFDPAAAPLGTDEEAAGTPPSPAEVRRARRQEHKPDADPAPNAANPDQTPTGSSGSEINLMPIVTGIILLAVLALVVWGLLEVSDVI